MPPPVRAFQINVVLVRDNGQREVQEGQRAAGRVSETKDLRHLFPCPVVIILGKRTSGHEDREELEAAVR